MTLGEYRVGISFNPSGDENVSELKKIAADFIDSCESIKVALGDRGPEVARLFALAQTHAEDAAMWAVKAVTKQPRT